MKWLRNKFTITFMTVISLLAVFVCAISTAAWFQLDTQPITTNLVTSSPNLQVDNDNVASYKIPQTTDANGFIDYGTTSTQKTIAENISVGNGNQASADTNFNVPHDGIGYYLVKQNGGGTYTFQYYGTSFSWKLTNVSGTTRYYNSSVLLSANDLVCIKYYDFVNHSTSITTKSLDTCSHGGTLSSDIVTVSATDTYKVWLTNSNGNWDLSLESTGYVASAVNRSRAREINPKRANSSSSINATTIFMVNETADFLTYDIQIAVTEVGYASGYAKTDLVAWFLRPSDAAFYWGLPSWHNSSSCAPEAEGSPMYFGNTNNSATERDCYGIGVDKDAQWREWVFPPFVTSLKFKFNLNKNLSGEYIATAGKRNVYGYYNNGGGSGYYINQTATVSYSFTSCTIDFYDFDNSSLASATRYQYSTYSIPSAVSSYESTARFQGWCATSSRNSIDLDSAADINPVTTSLTYYAVKGTSTTDNTYYFYLNSNKSGCNWSTIYYHAWGASDYPDTVDGTCTKTTQTISGTNYERFAVTISEDYTSILFRNNSSNFDSGNVTVDITSLSSYAGKYYVLSGTTTDNNKTKYTGSWYASIDIASSTLYDYYVFDQEDYLQENSGSPYVYAWYTNAVGTGSNTFYITANSANAVENAAWPGEALLTTDGAGNSLPDHVYRFRISSTYDSFILNNGKNNGANGAFQTQDLSTLSGHNTTTDTTDSNTWYFVFSGKTQVSSYYQVAGSWEQNISTISLNVSFGLNISDTFTPLTTLAATPIGGGTAISGGLYHLANQFHKSGLEYMPSTYTTIASLGNGINLLDGVGYYTVADDTNDILYYFAVNSMDWYKDAACTNSYVEASDTDYTGSLYIKASMDALNLTTIHVDSSSWGGAPTIKDSSGSTVYLTCSNSVAPNLYLVTLPSDWAFKASYNSSSTSSPINMASSTGYLLLSGSAGTWCALSEISIGTAKLYIYENSDWSEKISLDVGDLHHYGNSSFSNWFIYELGYRMSVGTKFKIEVETNANASNYGLDDNTTYTFDDTGDYNGGSLPSFLTDSSGLTTSGYSGYARFNFYVCSDNGAPKVSVAMVPDYGNGYYIMTYNSSTDTYIGGHKMNNNSDYTAASYVGYYVGGATTIYIRKYIDAVDTLITGWAGAEDGCAEMSTPGQVTIASKGYYNINVDSSGQISVAPYVGINDAFKLNQLDTSRNSTRNNIKAQHTTLFLEVPFIANNTYRTSISLEVTNSLYEFVGVGLYVTNTQLNEDNIYNTLTANTYYNNLTKFSSSSGTTITNLNTSFTATNAEDYGTADASATMYYAYIIIDYLPTEVDGVSYENFANSSYISSYAIGFNLIGSQYIAS